MDFKMHEYTHAIVGKITPMLVSEKANYSDARRQHDCYLRLLRELDVEVVEVDIGNKFPSNVILEDIAIVCHGIALITKPNNDDGNKAELVKKALLELNHSVVEILDPDVKLTGSDVLFTGREFFVNISETSNEAGANTVAETFPEFPCTPIKLSSMYQPLKKYVTVSGEDVLCVGASKEAKEALKRMEREANFSYQTVTVPEDEAANCLFVNGTLIHRAIEEIPYSFKVFCEKIDFARRSICFSELSKVSNGLSSCALLVRKPF